MTAEWAWVCIMGPVGLAVLVFAASQSYIEYRRAKAREWRS